MDELIGVIGSIVGGILILALVVGVISLVVFPLRQTLGLRFLDDIQQNAPEFLKSNGFEVIGCQGYQTKLLYGSAFVWFTIKRDDLIYECGVLKRRGSYHLYNLQVKNAVNINTESSN